MKMYEIEVNALVDGEIQIRQPNYSCDHDDIVVITAAQVDCVIEWLRTAKDQCLGIE